MSEFSLTQLSPEQRKALVQQVSERVRQTLQIQSVPPTSEIRGTWHEPGLLRGVNTAGADRIGTDGSVSEQSTQIAKYIDHTLLKPTATRADVLKICQEAKTHGFASVCLNTTWIGIAAQALAGSTVKPIAVVGFPLGAMVTAAKAAETREAISSGAKEIDMVINIGALKSGDHNVVFSDVRAVVEAAQGYPVKVILETAMLNRAEKIAGCAISKAAGAHFVKTSTGFGGGGATVEDVELMRSVVGPEMGVKASGGVRSAEDLKKMVAAGATRVGASASVAIVSGQTGQSAY